MLTFNDTTPRESYEKLFGSPRGTVFKVAPYSYETVMLRIEEYRPSGIGFSVSPINPGTSLYTQYGCDHCIVTRSEKIVSE